MKYKAKLRPNYFSVSVSNLGIVFRRQIKKKPNNFAEIVGFVKIVGEIQQLVWKRSQKNN